MQKHVYLELAANSGRHLSLLAYRRERSCHNVQEMKQSLGPLEKGPNVESSFLDLTLGMKVKWQSTSTAAEGIAANICSIVDTIGAHGRELRQEKYCFLPLTVAETL